MIHDLMVAKGKVLDLRSSDRDGVVRELVESLLEGTEGENVEKITGAILAREEKGSTAILPRFALPHARSEVVSGFLVALGLSREGITFGAPDGQKTHVFFAITHDPGSHTRYLNLLSRISLLFSDSSFLDVLLAAESAGAVLECLMRREEGLFAVKG